MVVGRSSVKKRLGIREYGNRDGQPRSGPDRDLVRPIGLDRLDRDLTGPTFRFGFGLISMIQMSVRSYNSPRLISVRSRSRSKRFVPIGRTRDQKGWTDVS